MKISLFIGTACAATLLATIQVMEAGSADTHARHAQGVRGDHRGGDRRRAPHRRLRHGLIGALFGALIFGFVQMGIFYTGIDTDWFKVFLGAMILIAVLVNNYIRAKALGREERGR